MVARVEATNFRHVPPAINARASRGPGGRRCAGQQRHREIVDARAEGRTCRTRRHRLGQGQAAGHGHAGIHVVAGHRRGGVGWLWGDPAAPARMFDNPAGYAVAHLPPGVQIFLEPKASRDVRGGDGGATVKRLLPPATAPGGPRTADRLSTRVMASQRSTTPTSTTMGTGVHPGHGGRQRTEDRYLGEDVAAGGSASPSWGHPRSAPTATEIHAAPRGTHAAQIQTPRNWARRATPEKKCHDLRCPHTAARVAGREVEPAVVTTTWEAPDAHGGREPRGSEREDVSKVYVW